MRWWRGLRRPRDLVPCQPLCSVGVVPGNPPLPCRASPPQVGRSASGEPFAERGGWSERASPADLPPCGGDARQGRGGYPAAKPTDKHTKSPRDPSARVSTLPIFTRTGRWKPPRLSKFNMALPSAPFGGFLSATPVSLSSRHWRRDRVCRTGTSGAKLEARFLNGGPAVSRGRPFSADPGHEGLRPTPKPAPAPPRRHACRCIR
jgi:hypothetical protein